MRSLLCAALALLLAGQAVHDQGDEGDGGQAARKRGLLLVRGEGFLFEVAVPAGWHGDTENADALRCHVLFYRSPEALKDVDALGVIRVRIHRKLRENARLGLAEDEAYYRRQFIRIERGRLAAFHPGYMVFAAEFRVPQKLHEYVAYLSPGPRDPVLFSVAMNTGQAPADEAELAAFQAVVHSLTAIGPGLPDPAPPRAPG